MNRTIIISSSSEDASTIETILKNENYKNIIHAKSGGEARRLISSEINYELIIINTPLSDEFGLDLALMVSESTSSEIIMLCELDIADEIISKIADSNIHVTPKQSNKNKLIYSIRSTNSNRPIIDKENSELLSKIDEIRLINNAKCTLIQYLKFTEPQAHRYIEKQAMNNRQRRQDIAKKILDTYKK